MSDNTFIYLKEGDLAACTESGQKYNQLFLHRTFVPASQTNITNLYINGTIDDSDVELVDFLYKCRFVTKAQFMRYAQLKGITDTAKRLETLCKYFIINRFILAGKKGYSGTAPADAEMFYCLHEGGKLLLENYTDRAYICWEPGMSAKSAFRVIRTVLSTDICLETLSKYPDLQIEPYPRFHVYGSRDFFTAINTFRFGISERGCNYLVVDAMFSEEEEYIVRNKILQYTSFFSSNIWKRYYPSTKVVPTLVIICDTEDFAKECVDYAVNSTGGSDHKDKASAITFTTFDRMKDGIGCDGALIGYDKDSAQITEFAYSPLTVE